MSAVVSVDHHSGDTTGRVPASVAAVIAARLGNPARLRALTESGLDARPDPRMEAIAERARQRLDVPVALVSLVRPDRQVIPGAAGLPEPWASTRTTPLHHSLCRHVVVTGAPLVVADTRAHLLVRDDPAVRDLGVRAYAGMPLTDERGNVLGALCVVDRRPRDWSATDREVLRDLADTCSTELRLRLVRFEAQVERAHRDQLDGELRRSYDRARTLLVASQAFTDTVTVDDVRARVAELVGSELAPSYAALSLLDEQCAEAAPLTAAAARERRVVVHSDRAGFDAAHPEPLRARLRELGLHAVAVAPLLHDDPAGALVLGWDAPHPLEPPDVLTVSTLAVFAAHALDRAVRLRHRIGVAHQLQQAMLTDLPAVPGLDMAACYHPADSREFVGGDWYDAAFVPAPQDPDGEVLAVCVGDVVGHTLHAATVMGQVRPMLRQAAWDRPGEPPSHTLTALELATDGLGLHATGTAVLAHLRRAGGGRWSVTWSNAGHPPPILVEPDGTTVVLDGHDILFGYPRLRPGPRGDHHRILDPGSTLFLYTDGLVERRGADIDDGIAGLCRLLRDHRDRSPAEIVDTAVTTLAPDAPDDVVAFALHLADARP